MKLGISDGFADDLTESNALGCIVGCEVGMIEGRPVGTMLRTWDGIDDGMSEGSAVGNNVGCAIGTIEGRPDG